jgi:hypothetical protein
MVYQGVVRHRFDDTVCVFFCDSRRRPASVPFVQPGAIKPHWVDWLWLHDSAVVPILDV